MKLGIVAEDFPPNSGGMAVHAENLARELAKSSSVIVFTRECLGIEAAPFEQRRVLCANVLRDADELASHQDVDAWLFLNAGYSFIAPRMDGPVFVYFHGNDFLRPYLGRSYQLVDRMADAPFIWRYAGRTQNYFRRRDIRRGMRNVIRVFTNSTYCSLQIRRLYKRNALVVHPGVHDSFFSARNGGEAGRIRQSASCGLRLLSVSRLPNDSRKNIDGVLRAIASLPSNLVVEYSIVGEGRDRERLEQLARDLGISDRVVFRGRVPLHQLLESYKSADLFVLAPKASRYDVEGFGMVYVEASATGTPVLGSREAGATDAIQHGVNGLLLHDSSPESIAAGIEEFATKRGEFRSEEIVAFAQRFRWPIVVEHMRDAIEASI